MPDTPVDIEGNAEEITISLPLKKDKRERKLVARPRKKSLRVIVKTESDTKEMDLGENWQITIE